MQRLLLPLLAAFVFLIATPSAHSLRAESILRDTSTPSLLEQARAIEKTGRYDDAIALYQTYLNTHPDDDAARAGLARVLSWQGRYQEAVDLYQDILSRHPADLDVRTALARVKSWQKHFDESQALYEDILKEVPDDGEAKQGLADVFYWTRRFAHALRLYEEVYAVTQDPEVAKRIRAVKAELAGLGAPQKLRAPVGLGRPLPILPFRDYFKVGYSHFTYTNRVPDERNWRVEAGKALGAQTLVGRIETINRFGFHDTPLSGELYSPLWQRAWGYVAASAAVNPHFVPNWTLGGELFQGLGVIHKMLSFLEPSFGYRRMAFASADVDLLIPGLTVYLPHNVWLTEKVFYVPDTGAITLSSQLTWRPADRVQLFASGGFGTSGERITAVQDFTRVSSRIIQGGIIVPLSARLSAETSVYYEDRGVLYIRRGGTVNLVFQW